MTDMRKLGNLEQQISVREMRLDGGEGDGKRCVLVHNGALEALFSKDNALDISYVRYKGQNISFLSKNGLNNGKDEFVERFEGGFLYTCGADSISNCVEGRPMHGSLHLKKCSSFSYEIKDAEVKLKGVINDTALFGKNLQIIREYTVGKDRIEINDTYVNLAYTPVDYVLLYHINFGYPFLDECLNMDIPYAVRDARTEIAKARFNEADRITAPVDGGDEDVYFHEMREGRVKLFNPVLNIGVELNYSKEDFPCTLEWKSMISGDYALGIEPATTRFDRFKMCSLEPLCEKNYKISVNFS